MLATFGPVSQENTRWADTHVTFECLPLAPVPPSISSRNRSKSSSPSPRLVVLAVPGLAAARGADPFEVNLCVGELFVTGTPSSLSLGFRGGTTALVAGVTFVTVVAAGPTSPGFLTIRASGRRALGTMGADVAASKAEGSSIWRFGKCGVMPSEQASNQTQSNFPKPKCQRRDPNHAHHH